MAGINQLLDDDVQNIVKKVANYNEETTGGYQFPPGLLEALGLGPINKPGGRKATNIEDQKANEILKDYAAKPIRSTEQSEGSRKKSFSLLRERARALASRSKFYEASTALEEVEEDGEITDLGTKLLMAECYLQLGRENRANKCLKHVEKALTSPPFLESDSLVSLAKEFIDDCSYVRAMIILKIATEIIINGSGTPDEKLSGVYRCYSKLDDIVTAMLKEGDRNRTLAADLGIESMHEMYEKIRGITNCRRDDQVVKEAWCCRYLDHNYALLHEHRKCVQYASRAIKNLEDHFTPIGAQRYRIYGSLLHNLGITLCNTQKFDEALAAHQKALEAKENALDYEHDLLKKKDIDETKKGLKLVRTAMGRI